MRDLLPDEARSRRLLGQRFLEHVALHGFDVVTLPAFETAAVLERGLDAADREAMVRFVEPGSGSIVALRPDMTPQIARMAASRLRDAPLPLRLAYEGTVFRRPRSRSRQHWQIPQVGLELLGKTGTAGDVEVLLLVASAVRTLGIEAFLLELGHGTIVRTLLAAYSLPQQARLTAALEVKDQAQVARLAREESTPPSIADAVTELARLHGDQGILEEGQRVLQGTPAASAIADLQRVVQACTEAGLGAQLRVDLGEVRGLSYYTGPLFHVFAEGPGEAIGSGGRYDDLLGRFGAPLPAVGAGFALDAVAWARRTAGATEAPLQRIALGESPEAGPVAVALRQRGIAVAMAPGEQLAAFAQAHGYPTLLWFSADEGWVLERLDIATRVCHGASDPAVAGWVEDQLRATLSVRN